MTSAIPSSGYGSSPELRLGEALPGRLPTDSPLRGCALSRSGHMASAPLGGCFESGRFTRKNPWQAGASRRESEFSREENEFMSGVCGAAPRRLACEPLRVEGRLVGINRPCGARDAAGKNDQCSRGG